MSDQITYGAGGVPYVGGNAQVPKKQDASEAPEEIIEEPKVIVTVTEDDRPLTDDQVVQKVIGKK